MGRPVSFDFTTGGGSPEEFLMGTVHLEPTLMHTIGNTVVLPDAPYPVKLVNGKAVHPNVAVSPAGPEPEWAYKVTIENELTGKSWSEFRGVPTGTTQIAYKDLTKFVTTIPPETTAGMMQNWADTAQDGASRAETAADRAEAPTDLMNKNLIEDTASLTNAALTAAIGDKVNRRKSNVPRLLPAPVVTAIPANVVDHGFTLAGANLNTELSNLNSTEQVRAGKSQSIKIVTNGLGQSSVARSDKLLTNFDTTGYDLRVWLYVPDEGKVGNISVQAISAGFANSTAVLYTLAVVPEYSSVSLKAGRWTAVDIPMTHFGGTADLAAITELRFQVTDRSVPATIYFDGFEFTRKAHTGQFPNGVVSITADDSYGGQWTELLPKLNAYGWRATLFPIISNLDTPGFLTTAQVKSLHDDYGWEIAAHASSGTKHAQGWGNMTTAERDAEAATIKAWQDSHGFASPVFAWPLGTHTIAAEADAAKHYSLARNAIASHPLPQYPGNPYSMDSINSGTQFSTISNHVGKAARGAGWVSLTLHDVRATGGSGNDMTPANLDVALKSIADSGATVLPMGEALIRLAP